jgi:two-component system NtrC family response regulator
VRALRDHPWPGNVRELENRVRRAVILDEGGEIGAADLDLDESAVAGAG